MKRVLSTPLNLLLLFAVLAIGLEFFWLHLLVPLDNRVMDIFVRTVAARLVPDPDIVIVDIDQASLDRMNDIAGNWPWPRSVHGELVEGIARQKPKAIVFDIWFSEPDRYRPESDAYFNEVLAKTPNVYLPMLRQDASGDAEGASLRELAPAMGLPANAGKAQARASLLLPKVVEPKSWRLGLINFLEDRDGIGRRYFLYQPKDAWRIPSLPVRVAKDLGYAIPDGYPIRDDAGRTVGSGIILGWRGGPRSHTRISYADLYADFIGSKAERKRPADELKGKIVIIGTAASGLHDIRSTPVDALYPAVQILAMAIDNLKNRGAMSQVSPMLLAAVSVLLVLGLWIAFRRSHDTLKIGVGLLVAAVAMLFVSYLLVARQTQVLLPMLSPLPFALAFFIGAALDDYLRERKAKEAAVQMFSRFVNPHVVQELVASGGLSRAGEERQVTLLFSDIRGFTTLSEKRTPAEVVTLLNSYFSLQVGVVFSHGGSLDKFIGDAIMAFWGAPLDDPEHARHGIEAALDMCDTLEAFRLTLPENEREFDVGIGLHSGPAVVGLIGSEQRREYTAIGDTVNLASRIEGLTKGIARVLVSEDSKRLCPDAFEFIDRGSFKAKGRAQEVRLYEPRRKLS